MSLIERFDHEARRLDPTFPQIDHAASAKANLEAAGREIKEALLPDMTKSAWDLMTGRGASSMLAMSIGMLIGTLGLPWAMVGDVLELPVKTAMAGKDLVDAGVHGIAAGFEKIAG